MKKNIRQEIMDTARELFNQFGYNEVSQRDIANALGISVGNLTYHFKRKEELVETIVVEQHVQYVKPKPVSTLTALDAFFERMLKHHQQNSYYFKHYRQLSHISDKIHDIQQEAMNNLYAALMESFKNLQENNLLQTEAIAHQYESLIQIIMASNIYGIPEVSSFTIRELRETYWNIIYVFLSNNGKTAYQLMLSQKKT